MFVFLKKNTKPETRGRGPRPIIASSHEPINFKSIRPYHSVEIDKASPAQQLHCLLLIQSAHFLLISARRISQLKVISSIKRQSLAEGREGIGSSFQSKSFYLEILIKELLDNWRLCNYTAKFLLLSVEGGRMHFGIDPALVQWICWLLRYFNILCFTVIGIGEAGKVLKRLRGNAFGGLTLLSLQPMKLLSHFNNPFFTNPFSVILHFNKFRFHPCHRCLLFQMVHWYVHVVRLNDVMRLKPFLSYNWMKKLMGSSSNRLWARKRIGLRLLGLWNV